jgi:CBS domain-containing protein
VVSEHRHDKEVFMKVSEVMTAEVISVSPEASLKEAARQMIDAGISGLPVVDGAGTLVGIISEADFVKTEAGRRAGKRAGLLSWMSREKPFPHSERTVGEAMTTDLVTIGPDADHAEAARLMRKARVKRLPVVDELGKLVGLVSRTDILRVFVRPDAEIIDEIRERVMRKVLWVDPRTVKVVCEEGNVSLSGTLETQSDAELLVELARRLDGVVSVQDHLRWSVGNSGLEMLPPVPIRRGW